MSNASSNSLLSLPQGYVAIPLSAGQSASPLRLCVLVRAEPDRLGGSLVTLRDTLDAVVYLGCTTDAAGVVLGWVEVWVQRLEGLQKITQNCLEALTNQRLDARWQRQVEAFESSDSAALIHTGWELSNPQPTFLDLATQSAIHPADAATNEHWQLCKDDALLTRRGLPAYGASLARYLYLPSQGEQSLLVPADGDAPSVEGCVTMAEALGQRELIPLNPAGGFVLVRRYSPLGYQAFADLLGGVPWEGVSHGRSVLDLGLAERLVPGGGGSFEQGTLLLTGHGVAGRLVEALHLKLRLIAGAIAETSNMTRRTGRPLLSLSDESFGVCVQEPASGLPHLWTARVSLSDPGQAVALSIDSGGTEYYQCASTPGLSSYRAEAVGEGIAGRATLRIRQVIPDARGIIVEGTFSTRERIRPAANDLVWIRVNIIDQRVDLYARLESASAMASGEWRFKSLPSRMGEPLAGRVREAPGATLPNATFELLPLLSTPCDLYSLAVLATATLFTGSTTALDEMLSLARAAADSYDASKPLESRIASLFAGDERWAQSLGPQRLVHDATVHSAAALDLVPAEIWFQTLAAIVRMFPAVGPDSHCKDFGDAPPRGVHKVFESPMLAFERLITRTRSLVVIDWRLNREVHSVIRRLLAAQS